MSDFKYCKHCHSYYTPIISMYCSGCNQYNGVENEIDYLQEIISKAHKRLSELTGKNYAGSLVIDPEAFTDWDSSND